MKTSFRKILVHATLVAFAVIPVMVQAYHDTSVCYSSLPVKLKPDPASCNASVVPGDSVIKFTLDNEKISESNFIIDAQGDIFTTSYTSYKVLKLVNRKWVSIQGNITDNVVDLTLGGDGSLYASSFRGLYKWKKSTWVLLGEHKGEADKVMAGHDGNLYANRDGQVIKWVSGGWVPVGQTEMKSIAPTFEDYFLKAIDAAGRVYVTGKFINDATGKNFVACWTGSTWNNTGDMPGKIYDLYIDDKDIVYVLGYADGIQFFMQWDGTSWTPVTLPPEINQIADLLQNDLGQIYLRAKDTDPERQMYRFYKLVNNQWEFVLEYPFSESGVSTLPVSSDLMYVFKSGNIVTEYRIVKK
jgi:hypothetical protein